MPRVPRAPRRRSESKETNEIEQMDTLLMAKYGLETVEDLYACIRWADFHITGKDIDEHWNIAAYAAFSGIVLPYRLSSNELRSLHAEFQCQKDLHRSAWTATVAEEMAAVAAGLAAGQVGQVVHRDRDHVAIAHRYVCATADDYTWPDPDLPGKLTAAQMGELNDYLEFVSRERLIPACKAVRLAAKRQLDDLARSWRGES